MSNWLPEKSAIFLTIISLVMGGSIGWFTSLYFAGEAQKIALEESKAQGRVEGIAQGMEDAKAAFKLSSPDELEARYNNLVQKIRDDAKEAGFAEGFSKGQIEGKAIGFEEGARAHENLSVFLNNAAQNWESYKRLIEGLNEIIEGALVSEGRELNINRAISQARAIVEVATTLNEAYSAQASSFNSIIADLAIAVEQRNFQDISNIAESLLATAEVKGSIFISNAAKALDQFQAIRPQ
jgi:hypothetical protein